MALTQLGFLIWDSRSGLNSTPTVLRAISYYDNFRPAVLVPKAFDCGSDTVWQIYDGQEQSMTTWGSYATGQRNGIAVTTEDGVVQLWDVYGATSSDEATLNSPHAKMEAFSMLSCNNDCDGNGSTLRGQYAGTGFPALASAATYCYTLTRTSDNGDAQSASLVELFYANYIIGAAQFISHTGTGAGQSTYRVCFDRPISRIGIAAGDSFA